MESEAVTKAVTFFDTVKNWALTKGLKLVIAVFILVVGFKLINRLSKKLSDVLSAKVKMDRTVQKTLVYIGTILAKIITLLCLISYIGIETAGLSALLASAGISIGMALNGTLSNLSGGVMLLLTRPFSIGDYISAQGQEGTVQDIHIAYTRILTNDKKNVYLPNSVLSSGLIINYSTEPNRRVSYDFVIGDNDPDKVRKIILDVIHANPLVLKDPAPEVDMDAFAEGKGTKLFTMAYCKNADYWTVYYGLFKGIHKAFKENGIDVPENWMDVKVRN